MNRNLLNKARKTNSVHRRTLFIDVNEDTAISIFSDVTSDAGGIPNVSGNGGSTIVFGTGKLFTFVTKVTGLWNVRHKGYASLCVLFVMLNILSVAAEILIVSICGPLVERCVSPINSNETKNRPGSTDDHDLQALSKLYEINEVMTSCYGFASTVTLILLIFSLHKLSKKLTSFSLNAAQTRVSRKEWLLINVILIVCVVVFVGAVASAEYAISLSKAHKTGLLTTYCLGLFINCTATLICVSVFAVVCCALGHLVCTCFEDIKNAADGNLSDIITIHQRLCQRLFIASGCFKVWFVVHWTMFGVSCLSIFAFNTLDYSVFLHYKISESGLVPVVFVVNAFIFVAPCVYASRVTWHCNSLLFNLNCARLEDWSENHPFRDRATLNEFIFYAERSQSGFRLGNFTFGSTGTWVSVFVGLIGLVLNLVSFINKKEE